MLDLKVSVLNFRVFVLVYEYIGNKTAIEKHDILLHCYHLNYRLQEINK